MKVKNMVKKTLSQETPENRVERRGKFVDLPIDLLFRVKVKAAQDSLHSGRHISETDVIQSALEAYLSK